jgi:hypothetical protein
MRRNGIGKFQSDTAKLSDNDHARLINGKALGEDQRLATPANKIPMVQGMNILQNSSKKIWCAFIFADRGSYAGIDAQETELILPGLKMIGQFAPVKNYAWQRSVNDDHA